MVNFVVDSVGVILRTMALVALAFAAMRAHALVAIGNYTPQTAIYQTDSSGSTPWLEWNPYLSAYGQVHIKGKHFIYPELGVAFHQNPSAQYDKHTFLIGLNMGYVLFGRNLIRYGVAQHLTWIRGKGGITSLPNGLSTSEFDNPKYISTASNLTAIIGLESYITRRFSLRADLTTWSLFDSERRSFGTLFTVNWMRP